MFKRKKCPHEVHSFLEIFHTKSYKTHVFNVLDSQEAVYFGWIFFSQKEKMAVLCARYIRPWNCLLPSYRGYPRIFQWEINVYMHWLFKLSEMLLTWSYSAFEALHLLPCSLVIAGSISSFLSLSFYCIFILKSKYNM